MSVLQSLKFFLKSVVYGSLIAGCAIYGVVASIVLRIVNKPQYAQYTVAKVFYAVCSAVLGLKITVKNEHYLKDMPAILVSNHQSALDIYMLGKLFQPGCTVTGKKSLKYVPFLGWFMYLSGTFFLDRSKSDKARRVLDSALASLKAQERALFMFPEGTRSASEKLEFLPFKKGAFHLAKQAGIPVIPVVLSNTSTIFNAKNRIFNTGEITMEILPPMDTSDLKTNDDVSEFALKVRDLMLESYKRLGYSKVSGEVEQDVVVVEDINTDTDEEATESTPLVNEF